MSQDSNRSCTLLVNPFTPDRSLRIKIPQEWLGAEKWVYVIGLEVLIDLSHYTTRAMESDRTVKISPTHVTARQPSQIPPGSRLVTSYKLVDCLT